MSLGMGEIGLLIILALVLFGAKRLPEVGKAAGDAIREFKSALNDASGKRGPDEKPAREKISGDDDAGG